MKEIPRPDDAADALAIAICHSRAATSLLNTEQKFDPTGMIRDKTASYRAMRN